MNIEKTLSSHVKWKMLFSLWALHGIFALGSFITLPADQGNFLFGLSFPRFVFTAFFIFWVILNFFLIVSTLKNTMFWLRLRDFLSKPKTKDALLITTTFMLFIRVSLWVLQNLLNQQTILEYGDYIDRLLPALNLIGFVCLECILILLFINIHNSGYNLYSHKSFFRKLAYVLFTLILLLLLISQTGLGIKTGYKGDWGYGLPAVPLLEWQIILACFICLTMILFEAKKHTEKFPRSDFLICILIWLVTCIIWLSEPVIPNASALEPRAPNYEIYPFIDAQTYDEFAQSVLIGNGFGENKIPQRPLYIVFLVFLHLLVGQDYSSVITAQTLFFAIFPVLLYLFGKEFFSRSVGISIALLAILRDYISNFVSPYAGNLSYSKVYLSEIPVAIFLLLFLFIGIRWIKAGFPQYFAFLMGGILGTAMLIRTQVIVALPLIIFFAILIHPKKIKTLIKNALLLLISLFLVISPWVWRNYLLTGELIFDSPSSQTINLALRYSRLNGYEPNVMPLPEESEAVYNQRLVQMARDAIMKNPSVAVFGILNSYLNHAVNNILLFPLRDEIKNLNDLWIPSEAFWEKWGGTPNTPQKIILFFYTCLLGLGIAAAWHRMGWLGLLPLGLNLIYNLWTSLALLSGQRFMVAMDWSIYLYYMIGLFTLIKGFLFILISTRSNVLEWSKANPFLITIPAPKINWQNYLIFGFLFFAIGSSPPAVEKIFPDKYPPLTQGQLLANISKSPSLNQSGLNPKCLLTLAEDNKLDLIQGGAVYPRYYMAGEGETFTDKIGYKAVDYGRLVFDIVGQANHRVIFPMSQSPDFFPHASDVTLVYGENRNLLFILVKMGSEEKIYVSESFNLSLCQ